MSDNERMAELRKQITARKLTGTLLFHPDGLGLYWSPLEWNCPASAVAARPFEWQFLGGPGWYGADGIKQLYYGLVELIGAENLPHRFGEYLSLKDLAINP